MQSTIRILDQRSMRLEKRINMYRALFFVFLVVIDGFGILLSGNWSAFGDPFWLAYVFALLVISSFVHFKATHAIKHNKVYRPLSFISVTGEIFMIFAFIKIILKGEHVMPMPPNEILLVISFSVILLNLLGAMRANKGVILYQTFMLTGMMTVAFFSLPERSLFAFYIPAFIVASGIFSLWITDILLDSYMSNDDLNSANNGLKNANEEIVQQNEEIIVQRDQIEKQHSTVLRHNKNITDSMRYAFRIQKAVFPEDNFMKENLPNHFVLSRPRDIVSGDFYWVHKHKNKLFIAVADCTGHGVPGAFMSMLGTNMLGDVINLHSQENQMDVLTPAMILDELREKVKTALHQTGRVFEMKDGMDMALIALNKDTFEMEYAGANNPLLVLRNNETFQIKADRMPVAIHRKEKPFTNHTFQLQENDRIYLYSDGFVDQFGGEEGQKLMTKRFKLKLEEIQGVGIHEQKDILDSYLDQWRGKYEQVDDILVMGIEV